MIRVFCDWCDDVIDTKSAPSAAAHKRSSKREFNLPGRGMSAEVSVLVEIETKPGRHICARCGSRAVAHESELIGPPAPDDEDAAAAQLVAILEAQAIAGDAAAAAQEGAKA